MLRARSFSWKCARVVTHALLSMVLCQTAACAGSIISAVARAVAEAEFHTHPGQITLVRHYIQECVPRTEHEMAGCHAASLNFSFLKTLSLYSTCIRSRTVLSGAFCTSFAGPNAYTEPSSFEQPFAATNTNANA